MKIKLTSIFVDNQDKALKFYTEVLGFVKKSDVPVGQFKWLTVVSPESPNDVELLLEPNDNPAAQTLQEAIFKQGIAATSFAVDDIQTEYARLKNLGVHSRWSQLQWNQSPSLYSTTPVGILSRSLRLLDGRTWAVKTMDEQALRQLLRKSKLDHIADEIVAQARPTVRVQTTPANEADIPIGASKMGGFPDLPPEFSYPYWHEALGFIGQFNMAETHPFDHEGLLPDHGLLSFFGEPSGEPFFTDWSIGLPLPVHSREDMYKGWQVHYFECDPSTLARFEPTDDLPEDEFYPCCAVNLSHTLTIPSPNSETLFPLKLTTHERTTLLNIDFEITFGEFEDHQRLGSPFELDGLPFIEAADQTDRWRRVTPEERLALERDLNQRWTVLFQLSSSSDLNMDWAGGLLYYCIERERLRVRDFTRVWLEMQFL